jgi:UDP-glucose 4-epimerase
VKRVILTGSTGFIGANLSRRLLQDGHELHLLLRQEHNPWRIESIQKHIQLHFVDLRDSDHLAHTVRHIRPDWIFHLAAYGAYSWQADLAGMIETNIVGTANLLNACIPTGFAVFVNAGSSSEYGLKDHAPPETECIEPNSHYAVTKASATLFCRSTAQAHNVPVPTLRLYSVYGPYEEPARLIPALIAHGFRNQLPALVNPDVARDYVYVDDVTEAFVLAATKPTSDQGAIYNVGTGIQTTLRDAVAIARRIMGTSAEPAWGSMPDRHWDTDHWVADSAKIKRELQWQPRYGFEEGFAKTVDWFRQNPQLHGFYEQKAARP